jgi:ABC-2 type transport system permease protein
MAAFKKIGLILKREYVSRVRKRSFIVMTILGPLLMAAMVVVPIYLATMSGESKTVAVIDETGLFFGKFKNSESIKFHYLVSDLQSAKSTFSNSGDYAILYIPKPTSALPTNAVLYAKSQVNINVKSYIRTIMTKQVEELKLEASLKDLQPAGGPKLNLDDLMKSIKANIDINTIKIDSGGTEEKGYTEVMTVLGFFAGLMIYFFIFMFGAQVMRGVIEEKTSRIVEVIISSVRPFELMMGKIVGVALVGLTQFLLWVILTFGIVTIVTSTFADKLKSKPATSQIMNQPGQGIVSDKLATADTTSGNQLANEGVNEVFDALNSIDFGVMIGSFVFFFFFGYLMYAALFAAIGGAVDSEADTQQFMLPITIPLIFAIIMAQYIIQNPEGPLSFWLSIIPLTSPVIMMVRIPFGVPYWQIFLSMFLLVLGFLGTTWLAAKIYRTGILMYGKKVSYKELWKWLRYSK